MKFLYEKVYSNQYFALILFATIAVLLILFGIVLLAAIRDTKKRKLAELEKLEKENINALQEKANILSSDEEIFGVEQAFIEENPKKTLEFFKDEDEQSETRDIVLSTPIKENSMNNLLNEFDSNEEKIINSSDVSIIDNNSNLVEHKDIVVPKIEVPIPEINQMPKEEILKKQIQEDIMVENVIPNVEEPLPVQEIKNEQKNILEETDDEFELPAIKESKINNNLQNINLEKSFDSDDINKSGIDFGRTGILNFSNIENETYEIK